MKLKYNTQQANLLYVNAHLDDYCPSLNPRDIVMDHIKTWTTKVLL